MGDFQTQVTSDVKATVPGVEREEAERKARHGEAAEPAKPEATKVKETE